MSRNTLFGAPTYFDPITRQRWIRMLSKNWLELIGWPPRLLESDLEELRPFFGNGASAKTIKPRIYALPEADPETRELPSEVALIVDGCALITPEGRILLEVLLDLQRIESAEVDLDRQLYALSTATALRSEWHARWLRRQFDSNISPAALGAALFLLVNGSVGEHRALKMPSDGQLDRELGRAIMPMIADFSEALGKSAPATEEGVRQHWAFTQVSRLLGRDVAREKASDGTAMFVRAGREKQLLETLRHLLAEVEEGRRHAAVMKFVEGYRRSRGRLAALGQMHEDPTQTCRITERLIMPSGGQ